MKLNRLNVSVSAVLLLLLTACASKVIIGKSGVSSSANEVTVTVPFITNRNMLEDGDGNKYFDDGRGELRAGYCFATGASERADFKPGRIELVPMDDLLSQFGRSGGNIVLYVHGYNIGFEKSCRRAAALQRNLRLDGRLLLFSWPADGNILHYARDTADLEWTVLHFEKLLDDLMQRFGAHRVDFIGHSLGARGLVASLVRLATQGRDSPVNELILLAPDIDSGLFRRDVEVLRSVTRRITLYVSDQDRALHLSRELHGYPRLGEAGESLTIIDGIDTVDISVAKTNEVSGHIYHIYSRGVTEDMRNILGTATQDSIYHRVRAPTNDHWELALKNNATK